MLKLFKKSAIVAIISVFAIALSISSALARPDDPVAPNPLVGQLVHITAEKGKTASTFTQEWKQQWNASKVNLSIRCWEQGVTGYNAPGTPQVTAVVTKANGGKVEGAQPQTITCHKDYNSKKPYSYFTNDGVKLIDKQGYKVQFSQTNKTKYAVTVSVDYILQPVFGVKPTPQKPAKPKANNKPSKSTKPAPSSTNQPQQSKLNQSCNQLNKDISKFPGVDCFQMGQKSPYVELLGKMLTKAGYGKGGKGFYKVGPTPTFTEVDRLSLQRFQQDHKQLAGDADGYPGPLTWQILVKESGYQK
ncbi:hypothetical protein SAMN05444392_101619 [Seinonella peptonophila]|uniref:Peptidoglycan binding domain-containing protein n=1 Tax=Seinonella peptonophila TaxID=112248 RepID=A0A1M4TSM7_9BACL|nr:peptidoglycan-binding protein [Seinonella peptonophila]SHE47404.1 hypothetical protein SAMN05444392_101619 [Seinonella peptonophila]